MSVEAAKLFISYSHVDEQYKDELVTALSGLMRNGLLSSWTDRELVAGDKLEEEIIAHLNDADIVIFLVSANFLESYFCFEKELAIALGLEEENCVRVVPVIVRPCDWAETSLQRFVAGNLDAKPISRCDDRDEAWLDVVTAIKANLNERLPLRHEECANQGWNLSDQFQKRLNSAEVTFQHRAKEKIGAADLFVYPHVRRNISSYGEIESFVCASEIVPQSATTPWNLLTGDEQSGKTSLAKMFVKDFFAKDYLPIMLSGDEIKSSSMERVLRNHVEVQFDDRSWGDFKLSTRKKVLLVDDFQKAGLNKKHLGRFIKNAKITFDAAVFLADSLANHDEKFTTETASMNRWTIEPMGNLKRGEMIERWVTLGREHTLDDGERITAIDRATRHVNSVVRKNILPARPLYILTILQFLDTGTSSDISLSSYGHCYQVLILQKLQSVKVGSREIDTYYNYLCELAFFMFKMEDNAITISEFQRFKSSYSDKFIIESHDDVVKNLLDANLLQEDEAIMRFSYRYIYYFFVAKYLADNIDMADDAIRALCDSMHTERSANILIFLVHHSRNQKVLDELLARASQTFESVAAASLDLTQTDYMVRFVSEIPSLVIEQRDIDSERKKELQLKDDVEREEGDADEEDASDDQMISEINRSYRMIDVIGQTLRNRAGSLTRGQVHDLALAGFGSGLRFLTFWLEMIERDHDVIVEQIQQMAGDTEGLSNDRVEKISRRFVLGISYGMCLAVLRKIANSIGSRDLLITIQLLSEEDPDSVAKKLICIAAQLEFTKQLPKNSLSDFYASLASNPIAQRLLVEIVVDFQYLNPVSFKDRQWMSSKLNIPLEIQEQTRRAGKLK